MSDNWRLSKLRYNPTYWWQRGINLIELWEQWRRWKIKPELPVCWPRWLGGLAGINIILSDHPLYSSHQHIQTNREGEHTARVQIETCNSGHTTFTPASLGPGWEDLRYGRGGRDGEETIETEWPYKKKSGKERGKATEKESHGEIRSLLRVWSEDLQACSGVSVWERPSWTLRGRGEIK